MQAASKPKRTELNRITPNQTKPNLPPPHIKLDQITHTHTYVYLPVHSVACARSLANSSSALNIHSEWHRSLVSVVTRKIWLRQCHQNNLSSFFPLYCLVCWLWLGAVSFHLYMAQLAFFDWENHDSFSHFPDSTLNTYVHYTVLMSACILYLCLNCVLCFISHKTSIILNSSRFDCLIYIVWTSMWYLLWFQDVYLQLNRFRTCSLSLFPSHTPLHDFSFCLIITFIFIFRSPIWQYEYLCEYFRFSLV